MNARNPFVAALTIAVAFAVSAPAFAQSSARRQRCYDVEVQRHKEVKDPNKIAGTAIGAVAGGLIGNQIGSGSGRKIATVAGAVGGGLAGRKIQENRQDNATETVIERRCEYY